MTMSNDAVKHNLKQSHSYKADRVEHRAVMLGSAFIGEAIYDDFVSDDASLEDYKHDLDADTDSLESKDLADDSMTGAVKEELLRRQDVMGDDYPFKIERNTIYYHKGDDRRLYEFLLCLAMRERLCNDFTQLFERVSAELVSAYFGGYAKHYHIGFPRRQPKGFAQAIKRLCHLSEELKPSTQSDASNVWAKDGGCDFVVWLEHADKRPLGQLFVFGQCACGKNWDSKLDELNIQEFSSEYFYSAPRTAIKVFATPHHVVDEKIQRAGHRSGPFFDRARITMIFNHGGKSFKDADLIGAMAGKIEDCFSV